MKFIKISFEQMFNFFAIHLTNKIGKLLTSHIDIFEKFNTQIFIDTIYLDFHLELLQLKFAIDIYVGYNLNIKI
jgi:hypothetical protein